MPKLTKRPNCLLQTYSRTDPNYTKTSFIFLYLTNCLCKRGPLSGDNVIYNQANKYKYTLHNTHEKIWLRKLKKK